jgi:hypothetical protein
MIGALRQYSGNYTSSMAALALVLVSAGLLVLGLGRITARKPAAI